MRGVVSDIYSTIQGEGIFVGERQVFIRLAGCPWRCRYCDTPGSLVRDGHHELSAEEVIDRVHRLLEKKEQKTVSVTGGEPLAQADFLSELLPALRRLDLRTYLETAGTGPEALRRVIDHCDTIAMDIKLPSAIGREFWSAHAEFLRLSGPKAFVKIILTADTNIAEFEKAVSLVAEQNPAPTLVLQPVTTIEELGHRLNKTSDPNGNGHLKPPSPHQLLRFWDSALHRLSDVRLIPQLHPIWGIP